MHTKQTLMEALWVVAFATSAQARRPSNAPAASTGSLWDADGACTRGRLSTWPARHNTGRFLFCRDPDR